MLETRVRKIMMDFSEMVVSTSVVSKYSLNQVLTREFLHFDTRTQVASTKRVTSGASFKLSKKRVL